MKLKKLIKEMNKRSTYIVEKKGNNFFNSKTLIFIFGGAILGFLLTQRIDMTIIGGIIGGFIFYYKHYYNYLKKTERRKK